MSMVRTVMAAAGISIFVAAAAVNMSHSLPDPPEEYRPRIQKECILAKEDADMLFLHEHQKETPEDAQRYLYTESRGKQ